MLKRIWNNRIVFLFFLYVFLLLGQVLGLQTLKQEVCALKQKKEILEKPSSGVISTSSLEEKVELTRQLLEELEQKITSLEQEKMDLITKRIYTQSETKEIYLTFDDGPSYLTEKNLEILKKYNVKATFFIINQDEKYDYLIQRMVLEGHTVGLHSYTHDYRKMYESVDSFFAEIEALQQKVKRLTGYVSYIIRFPGGSSNTISRFNRGIMTKLTMEVLLRGYRYFDWNVSSGDVSRISVSRFVKNSTQNKGKTSIMLLMHDSATKKITSEGLESVIQYYQKEGYTFQNITMNSPMFAHSVSN